MTLSRITWDVMTAVADYPPLVLRRGEERRLRAGHLWVFSNEVDVAKTPLNPA